MELSLVTVTPVNVQVRPREPLVTPALMTLRAALYHKREAPGDLTLIVQAALVRMAGQVQPVMFVPLLVATEEL